MNTGKGHHKEFKMIPLNHNVADSEYTDIAHTGVDDLSLRCINGSNVCYRCKHDTRQFYPSCAAFKRTANL